MNFHFAQWQQPWRLSVANGNFLLYEILGYARGDSMNYSEIWTAYLRKY